MWFTRCVIFLVLLNGYIIYVTGQDSIGDACHNAEKNTAGQCVLLKDCKSALKDIRKQIYPQRCGFQGSVPIVCCTDGLSAPVSKSREIAEKKCWEYSEAVYKFITPPVQTLNTEKLNISTCSIIKSTLIIGGVDAEDKEFPHMALLGFGNENNKKWNCGGSLISEQFVLTAGHCITSREDGKVKYIRLGELNLAKSNDGDPRDFNVIKIIQHPKYLQPSKYDDIMLLKMDRPTTFNEFIRPACLHLTPEISKKRYIATGWGKTEKNKGSDHLQKVILDSFSQSECNVSYRSNISPRILKFGIVPEWQLCAGGKEEEKDTCQGDSGGPLQIYHPQAHCMYSLVGVTSFGKECGRIAAPGVYTRVSHYIDWIVENVWP